MIHEQTLEFSRPRTDVAPRAPETDHFVSPIFVGALGGVALQVQRGVEPKLDHNEGVNAFDSSVR